MPQADDTREAYLSSFKGFADSLNGQSTAPIHKVRQNAIGRFSDLGFPTTRQEAWIHTNVAPLAKAAFSLADPDATASAADIEAVDLNLEHRLVFVNGSYRADLSKVGDLAEGVSVKDLGSSLESGDEIVGEHLAKHADFDDHAFRALNTAFVHDGAFIHVPKGIVVEEPIHVIHLSSPGNEPTVSHPRCLIVAGTNSQVTVVETFTGLGQGSYFTNAVAEIVAGDDAVVRHYRLQVENESAFHISSVQTHLGRGTDCSTYSFDLGGGLVRNEVNALLAGEGCEATVNGFYLLHETQHVDNHTLIEHAQPNCSSHELFKGVLGGRSRGVFRGKILVHRIAQKTDAYQQNQNLLLSDLAEANSKPQLEIYADDVKCSHGATIGQMDENALFYLRSRGIGPDDAQQLLVQAFGGDVIDRVVVDTLREDLHRRTTEKFTLYGKSKAEKTQD